MHPYIRELLAQRYAWFVPQARKEPFTLDMFQALAKYLRAQKDPMDSFLTKEFDVFKKETEKRGDNDDWITWLLECSLSRPCN
jgi:hypothetical protein